MEPGERQAPGNLTALHLAVMMGQEDLCAQLLASGADPNAAEANGSTPLHFAARLGSAELCGALLRAGANPNATDGEGVSPLQASASGEASVEVSERLVASGAEVGARDRLRKGCAGLRPG